MNPSLSFSGFSTFFFFFKGQLTPLFLGGGVQELLAGRPLSLHHHGLLAAQDGAGSAGGSHVQIQAVLVFADHVSDAAEGGPGVVVDGGLHVGGGRLSLADLRFMTTTTPLPWAAGSTPTAHRLR